MELTEYLEGIKKCPDEVLDVKDRKTSRLTVDFGVYDNFDVYLNMDFEEFISYFEENREYINRSEDRGSAQIAYLDTPNERVTLQIRKSRDPNADYETRVDLHPGLWCKERDHDQSREIANTIIELGEYAIENKIGLCLKVRTWAMSEPLPDIVFAPE